MLQNRKITAYIENHSAVYNKFATAAEKITRPKYLPTPVSILCHTDLPDEQASAFLSFQQIAQEEELDPDNQIDQRRNLSIISHDHILPAVQ
jgi:hypothetical protein